MKNQKTNQFKAEENQTVLYSDQYQTIFEEEGSIYRYIDRNEEAFLLHEGTQIEVEGDIITVGFGTIGFME